MCLGEFDPDWPPGVTRASELFLEMALRPDNATDIRPGALVLQQGCKTIRVLDKHGLMVHGCEAGRFNEQLEPPPEDCLTCQMVAIAQEG